MSRIRLLWLIDSLTVGGAESLVVPFARRVDRTRYELFVCCLTTIAGNAIEPELRAMGIDVLNLGARSLRDRAAFKRLVAFVRENKIDLVHAHLTYAAIWSALLTRKTKVPSIASLHVAPSATRALQASRRHRIMTALRDRLMRFVLRRWSTRVVVVSDALGREYGGLHPVTVHNGIELERFARPRVPRSGPPRIATVSVLRPKKGIEVLLDAARRVENATFLIIGDGPMREEWTVLAQRLGVADRVTWAGHRRDVDALLAGCDLFVHPSLDDAFPTVLLEALAAGLPIVASRVGGIPEIVEEGVTGHLVPPGDADALARAIGDALAHPLAIPRDAAQKFSTEAWIGRLDRVYEEALRA
ncbi:MAG TPA: glycosyltransferase [Thermoanaerobaculia bacterium]|nr:glycosyltransferase [Thermoanaerobaculia bacterium]